MSSYNLVHFINFCRKAAVNAIFFLIPLHFLKIGFNGWEIGIIMSLFAFAPLLFAFPTGWINDRISIKRIIQGALLTQGVLIFLVSRTTHFLPMASLFLLLGMANNALDVSTNSLYYKHETRMDLNRKYGRLSFWLAFGGAVGPFVGGLIIQFARFEALLIVFAVFLLVVASLIPSMEEVRFELVSLRVYKEALFRKRTLLFSAIIFVIGLHWGVEGTVYSPFLKSYFHLNNFQISLYISLPLFFLAFSALIIGRLKFDARINKRVFGLALLISGAGLILMILRNVYVSFAFRVVHELGDGLFGPLVVLFISRLFEKRSIGGSSGVLLSVMTFGQMVGAFLFSPLGHKAGLQYPFLVAGSFLVLNSIFSYLVFKREKY